MILRKNPEVIIKQGTPKMIGVSNCKNMYKVFEVVIGQQYKRGNLDSEYLVRGLYEQFKKFYPKKVAVGEIRGWKGKSGIVNVQKLPDRIIVTRFQKPSKDEEPKEVNIEISKEELQAVLEIINNHNIKDKIKTRDLAMMYSRKLNLGHRDWKDFFSDRINHNLLTNILGYLDSEDVIRYSAGVSEVLSNKYSAQLLL